MFDNKSIMVTGGTGSFGNAFFEAVFKKYKPKQVIIFSRDEKKQHDMRIKLNNPLLKFFVGDVRDRNVIFDAMRGVDYVFHAAALKQVPSCEFFPMEAVKTNILGANNVLDAAEHNGVKKVVVLSTDKAVYPINAMGMTKAIMEKLMIARSYDSQSKTVFCGVRYGNVMYSRGSVIPLFVSQIKENKPLTVTIAGMTRFLLPLSVAVDLVLFALERAENGDIFVRKAPAATMGDLARACINIFKAKNEIKEVGIREGEKMHETLVTQEELMVAEEFDKYYRIRSDRKIDYDEFFTKGHAAKIPKEGYNSSNTQRLSIADTEKLLLSLPEIQSALS
ncbi:MAG: polysaccharide biosynthesis protein [Candidatus Margulisbacteria bacterium]|nr:polysaccharide biosynthesis protein [Candidatus Margulisiibacteriota bacterium]MBU1728646.1 polysaccharide biosynthesis protein [Candidatus Margulisiibacteriota bacterium]MBU1955097.1 polysaccharide biosynthesis protein [Candidatus Margulisiibacteriota bacterium]